MAPKAIFSSYKLATTVKNMTESILEYVLEHYFTLDLSNGKLDYASEEMKAYNIWLDENTYFPIKKAKYSQLLFKNDYDEYENRYSDEFLKVDEIEEDVAEVEPETKEKQPREKVEAKEPEKEIKKLVGTFDEDAFWVDAINKQTEAFAKAENLKIKELKELISNYLFSDKKPLRDDVSQAMNEKPLLKDRAKIIDTLTEKIIVLANDLKTPAEE